MLEKQPDVVEAKAKEAAFKAATRLTIRSGRTTFLRQPQADDVPRSGSRVRRSQSPRSGIPQAGDSPGDSHAGPVLPRDRCQLQAVPDREEAQGRRGAATRRPACLLRGRPDHDRPVPRRAEPVRRRPWPRRLSSRPTYNISIVALEEAKGTLLEYDKITVVEHPGGKKPQKPKSDGETKTGSIEAPAAARNQLASLPQGPRAKTDEAKPTPASPRRRFPGTNDLVPGDNQHRLQARRDQRVRHPESSVSELTPGFVAKPPRHQLTSANA